MRNAPEFFGTKGGNQDEKSDIRSSLANKGGHGYSGEKRPSMVEAHQKLREVMKILPVDAGLRLARKADLIRKDPEKAREIMRQEIEENRTVLDLMDSPMSTDELLAVIDEITSEEKIQ